MNETVHDLILTSGNKAESRVESDPHNAAGNKAGGEKNNPSSLNSDGIELCLLGIAICLIWANLYILSHWTAK